MTANEAMQTIRQTSISTRQFIQLLLETLTTEEIETLREMVPAPGMEGLCSMENRDTRAKINYIRRTLSSGELSFLIEELTVSRNLKPENWL